MIIFLKRIRRRLFFLVQKIYYSVFESKVECNICHFKGSHLNDDAWHIHSLCPGCGSEVRHRLLYASLTYLKDCSMDNIIRNKKVLHFAPEPYLLKLFIDVAGIYKTADFISGGHNLRKVDYDLDMSDMKSIQSDSYDCVIACDVLEHIVNDINAMREAYRILRNGGYCIFTVPQKDNLMTTIEDLSEMSLKERELKFGQFDHLRIYGEDFEAKMREVGFETLSIDVKRFDRKMAGRYVLYPPVLSKHPLATNTRKIFFGQKISK